MARAGSKHSPDDASMSTLPRAPGLCVSDPSLGKNNTAHDDSMIQICGDGHFGTTSPSCSRSISDAFGVRHFWKISPTLNALILSKNYGNCMETQCGYRVTEWPGKRISQTIFYNDQRSFLAAILNWLLQLYAIVKC